MFLNEKRQFNNSSSLTTKREDDEVTQVKEAVQSKNNPRLSYFSFL